MSRPASKRRLLRMGARHLGVVGLLEGAFLCGAAAAPDFYGGASLHLAGVLDDNLFSTAEDRQEDRITRLTPALEVGCRSLRASIAFRYAQDAERYADHPDLDTTRARRSAGLDASLRAGPRLTLSLRADDLSTLTPGELNLDTGLAAGRRPATRHTFSPGMAWTIGPRASGAAEYVETRDAIAGGVSTLTRSATVDLDRRLSPRDTTSVGATSTRFDFSDGERVAAHALRLGWERRFSDRARLSLRAGPRFSEGRVDPEVAVAIDRGGKRLDLSFACSRTLATVVGRPGPVQSDSVAPAIAYRPWRAFQITFRPGWIRSRDAAGGPDATVERLDLEAAWRLGENLSFVGAYSRSRQRGALDEAPPGADPDPIVARSAVLFSLVAREGGRPTASGRVGAGD